MENVRKGALSFPVKSRNTWNLMDKSWILSNFCHDIQKDVGHLMGKSSRWWFQPTPLKNDGVRQLGLFFPIYP